MKALSGREIIRYWEIAKNAHPLDRALFGLAIAMDVNDYDSLAKLSIGQRDFLLIKLYQATFGDSLCGIVACPECETALQFDVSVESLLKHSNEQPDLSGNNEFTIDLNKKNFQLRLPNSYDLALAIKHNVDNSLQLLARQCIKINSAERSAKRKKYKPVNIADLNKEEIKSIITEIEKKDPYIEIKFDFSCVQCEFLWQSSLDILTFIWSEVTRAAKRLLGEVHLLAKNYGWSETDILSLNESRRKYYLMLVSN